MTRAAHVDRWPWIWPLVLAVCAWISIVVTLDPAGDHPGGFSGPGLTIDEGFNVGQGVALADRLLALDIAGFREVDARLPDHPPLGRLIIGCCHELSFLIWPPIDRNVPYSVTCARIGPATAFAVLVTLVGTCAARWYGRAAGIGAALSVILMPRVFGHAHLAALETMVNLSTVAVILFLAERWGSHPLETIRITPVGSNVPGGRLMSTAFIGGGLFGLALLTKVQAVLLPVPIAVWVLWHFRRRGLWLLAIWSLTGGAVFFLCWPYLWSAPLDHLREYLGRTTNRAVLYVWYFGQAVADRDVPWHYPWVMFIATVPLGLHLLGIWGVLGGPCAAWRGPREQLLLGCLGFPLCLFSLQGIAVYDGERLFSFVFPLWAVLIGRGTSAAVAWGNARLQPRTVFGILSLLFACQGYGLWSMNPCWLSYYNAIVGGLPGAARLGLPVSYWGDAVTRDLLTVAAERTPDNGTLAVLPTLHPAQWREVYVQCPALRSRDIRLEPGNSAAGARADYLLFFVRPEYLPEEYRGAPDQSRIVAEVQRQGVTLAVVLRHPVEAP